jgi:hypothetical protein
MPQRVILTDETADAERYIGRYLEFSQNQKPVPHKSVLTQTADEECREQLQGFNSQMEA